MEANVKEELQRIIAELERLEASELTDDERRLLAEAKSRLILVWQDFDGTDDNYDPLDDIEPRPEWAKDEE